MARARCDLCGRAASELVASCYSLRLVFLCRRCHRDSGRSPLLPLDLVETPNGSR